MKIAADKYIDSCVRITLEAESAAETYYLRAFRDALSTSGAEVFDEGPRSVYFTIPTKATNDGSPP